MKFDMKKVNYIVGERDSIFTKECLLAEVLSLIMRQIDMGLKTLNSFGSIEDEYKLSIEFKPGIKGLKAVVYKNILNEFLRDEESLKSFLDENSFEKFEVVVVNETVYTLELRVLFAVKKRSRLDITLD